MWGQIDGKAKITIAKEALNELVDELPGDLHVGLVAYGHRVKGDCGDIEMLIPLGPLDAKLMKNKIKGLNAKGMTPLSESVRQAAEALRYTEEKATVILVSDGLENCHADPCGVAAELAMSGVDFTMHVIGFDISKEEQTQLRCLADNTGGQFLAAENAQSLSSALAQTVSKAKEPAKAVVEDPGTAQLNAPASVPAGARFEIEWQGPDSRNDHISIASKQDQDQTYRHYVHTERGNPARLTAPGTPGDYELRYMHAQSGKVIGRADIVVTPVHATLQSPGSVQAGQEFAVSWSGPGYEEDYIALCLPGDDDHVHQQSNLTQRGNPAQLRAPADPGTYELRYVMGTDNQVLAREPLVVEGVGAKVEAPEFVDMAAEFLIEWQGPNYPGDFISIALPEEMGSSYKAYEYTERGNPLKLRAPSDSGKYEVRYVLGQDYKVLATTPVTVLGIVANVEAPESVDAAAELTVAWQGPNNPGDFISIALPDETGSSYEAYEYTERGNPLKLRAPSDPGQYEARYVLGQGYKILATTPINVLPVTAQVEAPESVEASVEFTVAWQGPNNPGDFISIALPDDTGSSYNAYEYTERGNPVKLPAPSEPGRYEVRYVLGQGYKVLIKAPLTVR